MTPEQAKILQVVKTWNDAFTGNDPDTYFTFIHDDLTLFIPSSPYRIDGKADDREEFEWSLNRGRTRVGFFQELQPRVQLFGEVAIATYYTRGAYGPEGQEQTVCLKETNVLVRERNEWRIVHIHVSR